MGKCFENRWSQALAQMDYQVSYAGYEILTKKDWANPGLFYMDFRCFNQVL